MGFSTSDISRNAYMLKGPLAEKGYDWWWHSFTARKKENGEEKAFFIEFFLCNPDCAEDTPVFGQLPENKEAGKQPSYLMVKAGTWGADARQLHRFFAWKQVEIHENVPYSVAADDCMASETVLIGSVCVSEEEAQAHPEWMCQAGKMSWNLTVDKKIPFNVGFGASEPLRERNAFEMYWHAEGMKTEYSGTVVWNGAEYVVTPETSYGYADKNWGGDFTSPWVWLSSNNLYSKKLKKQLKNSAFDIGGGRPRIHGVPLHRKLLGAFYYEGEEHEFNFSKLWTGTLTKFECHETADEVIWKVRQENWTEIMMTEVHCKKAEMLFVNYEAPDGSKKHNRLWNGGTGVGRIRLYKKRGKRRELIDDIIAKNIGCEYGEMEGEGYGNESKTDDAAYGNEGGI